MDIEEIRQEIEQIRDASKPGENTASRVGGAMLDLLSFTDTEFKSYLLNRLQGTAEDSDALRDPLKWLGSVKDDGGLNALLDGLHAKGKSKGKAKAGFFRGDYEGSPFTVENIPMAYDTDTWVQSVRGRFVPDASGMGLMRSGEEYAVLWRKCAKGAWGVWERIAGGVGRSAEGVTGGEIFNDYENNTVSGDYAHAEGQGCSANGDASHAEGKGTDVDGHYGHAEGRQTLVENDCGHAEGFGSHSVGDNSHAEGFSTEAGGSHSHAEGQSTMTKNTAEHAEGKYNKSNDGTIHSVGIGSPLRRKNALEVMGDGRVYVHGVGGYDGVLDEGSDKTLQKVLEELHEGGGTAAPSYAAFDFGVLQEKIGSGRTQSDLDAFGLTEDVWAKIRGAEIMVVRDDANERTYIVSGSSDDYISFQYGMLGSLDYEAYSIRSEGDGFTIRLDRYTGSGGGLVVIQ